MIKNAEILAEFERRQTMKEKPDLRQSLRLVEAMWKQGKAMGVLPFADPLEGIETDIKIARMLNRCSKKLS